MQVAHCIIVLIGRNIYRRVRDRDREKWVHAAAGKLSSTASRWISLAFVTTMCIQVLFLDGYNRYGCRQDLDVGTGLADIVGALDASDVAVDVADARKGSGAFYQQVTYVAGRFAHERTASA